MQTNRRSFIKRTAAVASSSAIPSALFGTATAYGQTNDSKAAINEGSSWTDIQSQFLLDPNRIHLAGLFLASHPKSVRDAIENYRTQLDQNPIDAQHRLGNEPGVLKAAAAYLNSKPELIALTDSTTMGIGLMYGGFQFQRGDHVLTSAHDHYSTLEALRFATKRNGASLSSVKLYDDGATANVDQIVSAIKNGIKPETRLVALTFVHSSTGVKLPLRAIADAIAKANERRKRPILFFVDGVHGFGIEDLSIESVGCDAFMAGCHKWIFGPRGTGIVWANERAWDAVEPIIPTFHWPIFVGYLKGEKPGPSTKAAQMTPGGFHSFEHRWALDEAFKFHLAIGKGRIMNRIHSLNTYLKDQLRQIKGLNLHTPASPTLSAGITTFEINGKTPQQIIENLATKNIIGSTTPYTQTFARLTPGILNDEKDVDAAVQALRAMET